MNEKILDVIHPVALGPVLRRHPLLILHSDFGSILQQRHHQSTLAKDGGQEQRRPAIGGARSVDVGADARQVAQELHLPGHVVLRAADDEVDAVLTDLVDGGRNVNSLDIDEVSDGPKVQLGARAEEVGPVLVPFPAADVQLEV